MNVIAITSCATGIAHSYMAAEAIEKICKQNGDAVKVEIQGALGIENALSAKDIAEADAIIFANDVSISKEERFDDVQDKIIRMKPHDIIKNPAIIYDMIKK